MKHITNFGGVFVYSKNQRKLAQWYKKHLGINYKYSKAYQAYYAIFKFREWNGDKAYSVWGIFENKKRPKLSQKIVTINYRVKKLDSLVKKLRKSRITVDGPHTYPQGRFAWIHDPDGNRLELWEDLK